jgi:hypothetical protein
MLTLGALLFVGLGLGLGLLIPSDRPEEARDVVVGEVSSADRLVFWTPPPGIGAFRATPSPSAASARRSGNAALS